MAKPNNIIEYFAGGNLRVKPSSALSSQPSKSPLVPAEIAVMADQKKTDPNPPEVSTAPTAKNKKVHFEDPDAQKDSEKTREPKNKSEKKVKNSDHKDYKHVCCNGNCPGGDRKSGANGNGRRRDLDKRENNYTRPGDNNLNRQADDCPNCQAANKGDRNHQQSQTNYQNQNNPNRPSASFGPQLAQHSQRNTSQEWFRYQVSEYIRRNMSRLLQPARSEVIIREDVFENETDPSPNAFFDTRIGVLRVYHGPIYGNSFASLSLLPSPQAPVGTPGIGGSQDWYPGPPRRGSPLGATSNSPPEWASQAGDIRGPAFGTRNPLAATNGTRPTTPNLEELSGSWGDKDSPGGGFGPPTRRPLTNGVLTHDNVDWSGAQPAHTLSWGRSADINQNHAVQNDIPTVNGNANINSNNGPWGGNAANAADQQNSGGNVSGWGDDNSNFTTPNNIPNGNTNGWNDNSGNGANGINDATPDGWYSTIFHEDAETNQAQNNANFNNTSPWATNSNNRRNLDTPWGVANPDASVLDNNTLLAGSWNGSGIGPPTANTSGGNTNGGNTNGGNNNQTWGNPNAAQSTQGWTEADHNEGFAPDGW